MTNEFEEPSAHERRVAQEEARGTGRPEGDVITADEGPAANEEDIEVEQAKKRWERLDAEDPDVMDEERDEPPPAGYSPRTG